MRQTAPNKVVVYEANALAKAGIRVWRDMINELWSHAELIWRLILRDILARYKQSFLGIFWALLSPLVFLTIFMWVKNANIIPIKNTSIPYPAFLFLGQTIWFLFSQSVTATTMSLANAGSMLTKINFPKESIVISSIGQPVLDFIIRIPLLIIIFLWSNFTPHINILISVLLIIPLIMMIIGLGFILSLANAISRDIGNVVTIALNIGMFATPVIYPPPDKGFIAFAINHINPIAAYLNAVRDLAITGKVTMPSSLLTAVLLSILIFFCGWRLFHLAEPKIAERA